MKAPNGQLIVATSETMPGSCGITWDDDGTWDHDGNGTEVGWDGQETVTRGGETVFLDEDGNEWLECELVKDNYRPRKGVKRPAWHRTEALRKIEIDKTVDALMERIGAAGNVRLAASIKGQLLAGTA